MTNEELGLIKRNIRLAKNPREQLQIESELHDLPIGVLQQLLYKLAPQDYTPEFKEKVLKECKNEAATVVATRYSIKPQTIYDWRKIENYKSKSTASVAPEKIEGPAETGPIVIEAMPEEMPAAPGTQQKEPEMQQEKLTAIEEIDLIFGSILRLCDRGIISKDFLPKENEAFLLGVRAGIEYAERIKEND